MKRFYKQVAVRAESAGQWVVVLDGKPLQTPARKSLTVWAETLAHAIAAEWDAQKETISPHNMPLTQLACTLQDKADEKLDWVAQLHAYLDGDGVLYRVETPEALVAHQQNIWLGFQHNFEKAFSVALTPTFSILHNPQGQNVHEVLEKALGGMPLNRLFAWQVAAVELGSTVLGWHVVATNTPIDHVVEAALLEDIWNDSIASPDRSNPDPMLEKKIAALQPTLQAVRDFAA